jgi:hypothetical protein
VKPLLGQLQNQAHLEDLLGSVKSSQGKFDRPAGGHAPALGKPSTGSSFNEMLLTTIARDSQPKPQALKSQPNKLPDQTPKIDRPSPKPSLATGETRTAEKPSRLAESATNSANKSTVEASSIRKVQGSASGSSERIAEEARASTVKSTDTANSEAKAALAPLRKQFNGKSSSEALLNTNAVLSFVSGRLDKIAPDALASVITDSSLIKQAMSSGDIASFMQTPMTIADLSQLFELDQGILNKAVMNGLDSADLVTAKEFLNALGLDAGRISAELTQLQQRLPVEGLKAYIDRAQALASAQTNASGVLQSGGKPAIDGVIEGSDLKGADLSALDSTARLDDLRAKTLRQDTSGSAIEIPVAGDITATAASASMLQSPQNSTLRMDKPTSAAGVNATQRSNLNARTTRPDDIAEDLSALAIRSGQSLIQTSDLASVNLASANVGESLQTSETTTANTSGRNISGLNTHSDWRDFAAVRQESSAPADTMNLELTQTLAASDPFIDMGRILDPDQATKIEFGGNGTTQRTLEELLIDRNFAASISDQVQKPSAPDLGNTLPLEVRIPMMDGLQSSQVNQSQISLENVLASSSPQTNAGGSFPDGMFQDQDSSSGSESSLQDQVMDIGQTISQQTGIKDNLKGEFVNRLSTEGTNSGSKNTFAAKILGHAQMLLKDGGGSMRVNVETPGMGKVDVAINLINNQLDVRIITASEQARDMISREVSGLRDGLGQQGISLRGLEIGKAGESSGRQFAGQGQQQFGQGARDQKASYDDMRQYVQSFKNAYNPGRSATTDRLAPTMNRTATVGAMSNAAGRLEVRI